VLFVGNSFTFGRARVLHQHVPAHGHLHQLGADGLQQRVQLVVARLRKKAQLGLVEISD